MPKKGKPIKLRVVNDAMSDLKKGDVHTVEPKDQNWFRDVALCDVLINDVMYDICRFEEVV